MGCWSENQQQSQANDHPLVLSSIQTARQVEKQDVEVDSGEVNFDKVLFRKDESLSKTKNEARA